MITTFTFSPYRQRPAAPLRLLYMPKLAETQKVLYVFEQLGKHHLGRLWRHLEAEGLHPTMFFTEWVMSMFCRGFAFDLVTRIWDIFISEGSFKIIYRVSLAIIKVSSCLSSYTLFPSTDRTPSGNISLCRSDAIYLLAYLSIDQSIYVYLFPHRTIYFTYLIFYA